MKRRTILVEGPDCSGKSTLINRLKNNLRWDSRSLHHKEGEQFSRYLREYSSCEEVVIDRGHISESVYSQLWNREKPFSRYERRILDDIVKERFIVVFSCPDLETLQKRYQGRDFEQQIKMEELAQSRKIFIKNMSLLSFIQYKSDNYGELDRLIDKIMERVK